MKLLKILFTLSLSCGIFFSGHAQYQDINFEHLTTEEGLSQNDVNAIAQDKNGFMWFGTHDGLNKYDGYNFQVFQSDPNDSTSISSNLIFALAEDPRGYLWVGTTGNGISLLDISKEKFKRFYHKPGGLNTINNNYITQILVSSASEVWVGSQNGLNLIYSEDMKNFSIESFLSVEEGNLTVQSIYEDRQNTIWIGTSQGLYYMDRKEGRYTAMPVKKFEGLLVRSISENSKGQLLVNATNRIFIKEGIDFVPTVSGNYLSLTSDGKGRIWAGSSSGINLLSEQEKAPFFKLENEFTVHVEDHGSINKNNVRCIYRGTSGIMWIGTNGGGVNKVNLEKKGFRVYRKNVKEGSISYDKIRAIFEDSKNVLWIGTEGGGLNVDWNNAVGDRYESFTHYKNTINSIFSIAETVLEDKRIIWIGSEDQSLSSVIFDKAGNSTVDLDFGQRHNIKGAVFAICSDRNNTIWVGTYHQGLYRLIPKGNGDYEVRNFTEKDGLSLHMIRSLLQDKQGNLWVGTGKGLNKISYEELYKPNPTIEVFKNIPGDDNSLAYDYILDLYETREGQIWVGTFGGGLNRLIVDGNGKYSFKSFKEADGLSNNVVKGILEDNDGYIWVSTNKGLNKFDPYGGEFKTYDVTDGLQSNEFSELAAFKRHDGEMLFGGVNGFNAFYPEKIRDNPFRPKVAITDFQIFNKSVPLNVPFNGRVILDKAVYESDEIHLKYWENNFTFEFAALHYAAPSKNRYRYKLEGFDHTWTETSAERRFASYTNIGHGAYKLMVQAANNDGLWNEQEVASIKVIVAPPFWLTWWAYIIYALMFSGLLYGVRKYTLIGIHKKHQLEVEHLTMEKTEELHQMKLRFFTNISHEFRTPLTLILGPLEQLLKYSGEYSATERSRMYVLMQKNARLLLKLINQLMDFRKIDQGKMKLYLIEENISKFVEDLAEPFQLIASSKDISFEVEVPDQEIIGLLDRDKVEKILYNLLSNAFKFTPKGGTVTLKIERNRNSKLAGGDTVVIAVQDTGVGIPEDRVGKVFERFFQANEKGSSSMGTGIGLSYTKSLVEMHQGAITFVSKHKQGTTFWVELPLSKKAYKDFELAILDGQTGFDLLPERWVDVDLETDYLEEIPGKESENTKKQPLKVLVVDDNAEIRSFIQSAFHNHFTILEAINGEQGLAVTEKENPDLIITDVMMPVMDGVEFCEKLKNNIKTSHIPVIMLTAKNSEDSELEGLQHGADFYLTKPFEIEKLLLSVNNLLKGREALRKRFTNEILLQPSEITVNSTDNSFLGQAMEVVEANMDNPEFTVEEFVKEMGMSRSKLHLKMKSLTDQSASEFIRTVRLKRAVQLMEQSDISVKEIMYQTGFNTASYFSKCFKKQFGVSPTEYLNTRNIKEKSA
ncbi:hybrid sensor histidine kinase/response regulator [Echinicola pacifica]|uniref:histidine kinase n=1 Tax=Echinicola pacifica TaxID=346377 RepID=A0A918PWW6_9BACT|nr:two-component regulator propeller domain-containing protein [Echinicola pacifica]GGZ24656.1 hybrid sensor histidine kinase/response regulator [Echinicola pacifica]